MNNNEEFIKKYNELDVLIDEKYSEQSMDSSIYFLINKYRKSKLEKEREYAKKLDSARKIRNLMIHESGIIDTLFEVSDDVISFLDELIDYIKDPLRAKDIMTPLNKVIFGVEGDKISVLINKIVEEGVSNIPILSGDNKVIGVFNSDVLLSLLLHNIKVDEKMTIRDILSYVKLENQLNLRFVFVTSNYEIDVLNDYFSFSKEYYQKRLPVIFVSENGKSDTKLLGIISPIDLISKVNN